MFALIPLVPAPGETEWRIVRGMMGAHLQFAWRTVRNAAIQAKAGGLNELMLAIATMLGTMFVSMSNVIMVFLVAGLMGTDTALGAVDAWMRRDDSGQRLFTGARLRGGVFGKIILVGGVACAAGMDTFLFILLPGAQSIFSLTPCTKLALATLFLGEAFSILAIIERTHPRHPIVRLLRPLLARFGRVIQQQADTTIPPGGKDA